METSEQDERPEKLSELELAVSSALSRAGQPFEWPERSALNADGAIDQTRVAFNVFRNLMETDGIRAALYSVLRKSDYRFIGIFRFQNGKSASAVHVDREDLSVMQASEVDDSATYCSHVRDSNGAFVTADAVLDPRTASHPARDVVRSYCGIPIFAVDGSFIGTLCHYDLVPRNPAQLDLKLLLQVCGALAISNQIPPYPDRPQAGG